MAAPVLDGTVTTWKGTADPPTISFTVSSNANRYLKVDVVMGLGSAAAGTCTVAWNGTSVPLVKDSGASANDQARALIFGLVAPESGTYNIVLTLGGTYEKEAVAAAIMVYKDVDQTTPIGTAVSALFDGVDPTVDVTSATGETVVDCMSMRGNGSLPVVGASQTERANASDNFAFGWIGSSEEAGATTVTMSWSGSEGFDNAIAAVPLKPVAASGTAVPVFLHNLQVQGIA
ncbi:MAG TPA: hypothetical protein VMX15_06435 [Candidatus Heimdallarchaeota archaeon]|nr:hypothetical protein [Candidatus Heimdallarchaeota archaeon]